MSRNPAIGMPSPENKPWFRRKGNIIGVVGTLIVATCIGCSVNQGVWTNGDSEKRKERPRSKDGPVFVGSAPVTAPSASLPAGLEKYASCRILPPAEIKKHFGDAASAIGAVIVSGTQDRCTYKLSGKQGVVVVDFNCDKARYDARKAIFDAGIPITGASGAHMLPRTANADNLVAGYPDKNGCVTEIGAPASMQQRLVGAMQVATYNVMWANPPFKPAA